MPSSGDDSDSDMNQKDPDLPLIDLTKSLSVESHHIEPKPVTAKQSSVKPTTAMLHSATPDPATTSPVFAKLTPLPLVHAQKSVHGIYGGFLTPSFGVATPTYAPF